MAYVRNTLNRWTQRVSVEWGGAPAKSDRPFFLECGVAKLALQAKSKRYFRWSAMRKTQCFET
jgi:hypothetical protein